MLHDIYKNGYRQAIKDMYLRINNLRGGSDPWEDALDRVCGAISDLEHKLDTGRNEE